MGRKKPQKWNSDLVYFEDVGAIYGAPIDAVWDFWLNDETFHSQAHRSEVRNFSQRKLSEVTSVVRYERRVRGRWSKRACRMTVIPPAVRVQEDLVGPDAGSIKVFIYKPLGRRTAVDVLAYMHSPGRGRERIERETRKTFGNAFREDLPWFRKYLKARASKGPATEEKPAP